MVGRTKTGGPEFFGNRPFAKIGFLLLEFRDPRNAYVNFLDFIPCLIIDHTSYRKTKNSLKYLHCIGGGRAVDAVHPDFWDERIVVGDCIDLFLHLLYFGSPASDPQIFAGPGSGDSGNFFCGVDIHAAAVEVTQNFDGGVALVTEGFAAPLGHPYRKSV